MAYIYVHTKTIEKGEQSQNIDDTMCRKLIGSEEKKNIDERKISGLPTELLEYILCRLAVKKIVQVRCVCKTWYEIITHPSFIFKHYDWSNKIHGGYLAYSRGTSQIKRFNDEWFEFPEKLEFPINASEFKLIGSRKGLLCMREINPKKHYFPCTYLWNPSIRALKKLPEATYHHHHQDYVIDATSPVYCLSEVGFDRRTNDYMVFHIVREKLINNEEKEEGGYLVTNRLYSLKTNSWKEIQGIDNDSVSCSSGYLGCCTYFNGAFYWIQSREYPSGSRFMMWFDCREQIIRKVKLPVNYDQRKIAILFSALDDNSLALSIIDFDALNWKLRSAPRIMDLWAMKKSSSSSSTGDDLTWDRQLPHEIPPGELGLRKDSPLYDTHGDSVVFGDPKGDDILFRIEGLFAYSQSLLLLEEGGTY